MRLRCLRNIGFVYALFVAITASPWHVSAQNDELSTIEYSGVVEAAREVEMAPLFDGWLTRIHFIPGQYVEEGDLLFEFSTVERNILLGMDKARLDRAQAEQSLADAELSRARQLRTREVNSEVDLLEAEARAAAAAASVKEAGLAVEFSELVLKYLTLRAPISGLISRSYVMENAYLTKAARDDTRMATITQLDPIRVAGEVPFEVFAERRAFFPTDKDTIENIELSIRLPDGTVYPHKGRYTSGGYLVSEATQALVVWADFPNPDHLLRPGLKVTVISDVVPSD